MQLFKWAGLCVLAGVIAVPGFAAVGSGYTLFGGATLVMPGNNSNQAVQLVSNLSNTSTTDDYSGIDFGVPAGLTFADIKNLALDYNFTHNSCAGGSPRFQINVQTPSNGIKNAFVYIGPPPNFSNCAQNTWVSTGNLATPTSTVDTSQILTGTQYNTFAAADAAIGSYPVVGIQVVTDSGWAFGDLQQTVIVDNVQINDTTYNFEPASKESCKDGGWKNFTFAPGPFKNQGDCVSYFATGGKH